MGHQEQCSSAMEAQELLTVRECVTNVEHAALELLLGGMDPVKELQGSGQPLAKELDAPATSCQTHLI